MKSRQPLNPDGFLAGSRWLSERPLASDTTGNDRLNNLHPGWGARIAGFSPGERFPRMGAPSFLAPRPGCDFFGGSYPVVSLANNRSLDHRLISRNPSGFANGTFRGMGLFERIDRGRSGSPCTLAGVTLIFLSATLRRPSPIHQMTPQACYYLHGERPGRTDAGYRQTS